MEGRSTAGDGGGGDGGGGDEQKSEAGAQKESLSASGSGSAEEGLTPRSIRALFRKINAAASQRSGSGTSPDTAGSASASLASSASVPGLRFKVHVSFLQIYQENVHDLLSDALTIPAGGGTANAAGKAPKLAPSASTHECLFACTHKEPSLGDVGWSRVPRAVAIRVACFLSVFFLCRCGCRGLLGTCTCASQ
jgi:hypothetical protein